MNIKRTITTDMLKRQVWMADDDEFDHIFKNSQRVLRLNNQYENHPYVEEFTKECNVLFVYGTYILEGEADAKFSLDDIWKIFQEDPLPNNASNFCRQMINCMGAWNFLQKTSDLSLSTECLQVIIFSHQRVILKDTWKTQFLGFMGLKKMTQLQPLQICLERWKRKNLLLDFGSCFDTDEILPISSHYKLLS